MVGTFALLLAANLPPASPPDASQSRPIATATARATARIQIISGVKFGPGCAAAPPSALRRSARLTEADGQVSSAILLEFQ